MITASSTSSSHLLIKLCVCVCPSAHGAVCGARFHWENVRCSDRFAAESPFTSLMTAWKSANAALPPGIGNAGQDAGSALPHTLSQKRQADRGSEICAWLLQLFPRNVVDDPAIQTHSFCMKDHTAHQQHIHRRLSACTMHSPAGVGW